MDKKEKEYVIIVKTDFKKTRTDALSSETAYLVNSYENAKEALHHLWEENYNNELADYNNVVNEEYSYHEDDYAKITRDDGTFMEFSLIPKHMVSGEIMKKAVLFSKK